MPANFELRGDIAIDTEAMGLHNHRDRLCTVQLSNGNGDAHIVHFPSAQYRCPNLVKLLSDPDITYIFHFGRFDIAIMELYLKVKFSRVYCTKIASRLVRTYTDSHGLKDLCNEFLGVRLSKQQQSTNWGVATLSPEQIEYAANDVLYLHQLRDRLNAMLQQTPDRMHLANECFHFLPVRARLDLAGWPEMDIFAH